MSEIFSTCDFYGCGEPNLGFTPKMKLPTVLHDLCAGFSPEYGWIFFEDGTALLINMAGLVKII